jgi:hypothetical protein
MRNAAGAASPINKMTQEVNGDADPAPPPS